MKYYPVIFLLFVLQSVAFTQTLQDTVFFSNLTAYHIRLAANCDYDLPVLFEEKGKIDQRTDSLLLNTSFVMEGKAMVSKVFGKRKLLLLRFQFVPANVIFSNNGRAESNDKAAINYLSTPVFIQPGTTVTGARLFYPPGIPSGYKQLINQLISYMHIIDSFPDQCPQGGCVIKEEDRIGVLESKYQVMQHYTGDGFRKYKKTSLGYISFPNNNLANYKQNLNALITTRNETSFNIELHELLTLLVQDKTTSITKCDFLLQRTGWAPMSNADRENLKKSFEGNLKSLVKVSFSDYIVKDEINLSVNQRILSDDNYTSVNTKIDSLHRAGSKTDSAKYYKKVAALIYMNPILAVDFAKQIAGKAASDIRFKIIVKGMADAGNMAAQKQLAIIFHSRSNDAKAIDFLISSLIFLDNPSTEIIDSIKAIALDPQTFDGNIAIALRYLLGSLCHQLKADNPVMASNIIANIITEISKQTNVSSKEKKLQMLGILGNAGLDSTFTIIQSYLNDPDIDVKCKALLALRLLDHKSIESLLLNVLDTASDIDLKNASLSVLQYKPFTPNVNDHVAAVLKKGTDDTLVISLIRFLKMNEAQCPGCYQLFKEIATQHSSEKVRVEAKELLKND